MIDDRHFFLAGNSELPVAGVGEPFSWGVWVSRRARSFARACEVWEQPGQEAEPQYFGWVATGLPGSPETLNLKTHVHTRAVGRRPRVEPEPTGHPLAVEQRQGITPARVQEIAERVLHGR